MTNGTYSIPVSMRKLDAVLRLATMIKACQSETLISPEDRAKFLNELNDKAHKTITEVIAEVA